MANCSSCPRACGADRDAGECGFCGVPAAFYIARCAKHLWEEPCISGKSGSGTVFFSGCNLRCVFCQNHAVSHEAFGRPVTADKLAELIFRLRDEGAHNINLVTPTHYARELVPVLEKVRPTLGIPIAYNCGGYERVETLRILDGLIDVYMPDFKYVSSELAGNYSAAPDYCEVATAALIEMYRQVGDPVFSEEGLMQKGMIVRHLILPGCRKDSIAVLEHLSRILPRKGFLLSLMSQYTPEFAADSPYPNLHRRLTSFEYESVLRVARELDFDGCCQERTSATASYTPDFTEPTF